MRRRSRGFTLVELMVSLVAGVIIAIAVVGLAKAATTSFYEQARLTSVEQSVRGAANRLRYDLTKASFMGTGNIQLASAQGIPYGHQVAAPLAVEGAAGGRYPAKTQNLQGIHIVVSGSGAADATLAVTKYSAAPNLTDPDVLEVGGNMTTEDSYVGAWAGPTGGSCGGGVFQMRAAADSATARLISGDPANVTNAFTPGPAGGKFLARVVDSLGCEHFVEVQNATATNAANNAIAVATVDLCPGADGNSLLSPGQARPGCGAIPVTDETLRISPYHRVRWSIAPNTVAAIEPAAAVGAGPMFMLYRDMLDSSGAPVPALRQIVAEYAVDLKFGIAVDARETNAAPNNISVFDLDSDTSGAGGNGPINTWTQAASATTLTKPAQPTSPGPQRVRSVKFRVSTRASLPDRTAGLSLVPSSPYIPRYCVDMPACTKFARVRTIVSEVPLLNQARMTY
jgi:type II secretory pathway pseudopilin PulG